MTHHPDIVLWSEEEAQAMHAGYKRRAGIPAAGTEPLFAAAMVGYRKAKAEAAALIEAQAAEVERLKLELAGRDAKIAAWLRSLKYPVNTRLCEELASAIASGVIEEKGSE